MDESENVIRNKGRLVAKSYTQIEGINFEETFTPVSQQNGVVDQKNHTLQEMVRTIIGECGPPQYRAEAVNTSCYISNRIYFCKNTSKTLFKIFQMDVKSVFLNDFIGEEEYEEQSPGFIDLTYPDFIFKLEKALYGLKQSPRVWYERLSSFQ